MNRKPKKREMFEDPQPRNDPKFWEEMFSLYQSLAWKPEDLQDKRQKRMYADWLKNQE